MNAAIRGVGKAAIIKYGMKVFGFRSGFSGLIQDDCVELTESDLSGILTLGGTILGTSREKPFKDERVYDLVKSKPEIIAETYARRNLDCLVCIGGNGTQKTANRLSKLGLNIIGMPKTIDNDVWGTDISFGFDSAINNICDALDKIHTTANSHRRIMVVETMGHHAGWLALHSGIAGGGDVILIPEIPYSISAVCSTLAERARSGKPYSIVVVAEGIDYPRESGTAAGYISRSISKFADLETRETILGYIQRGGSPSPADRIIATRLGAYAADLASRGVFGTMAAIVNNELTQIPLSEVSGKVKSVPLNLPLLAHARSIGTSFGDCMPGNGI